MTLIVTVLNCISTLGTECSLLQRMQAFNVLRYPSALSILLKREGRAGAEGAILPYVGHLQLISTLKIGADCCFPYPALPSRFKSLLNATRAMSSESLRRIAAAQAEEPGLIRKYNFFCSNTARPRQSGRLSGPSSEQYREDSIDLVEIIFHFLFRIH